VDVHSSTEYIACNSDNGGFPLAKTFLPHIIPVMADSRSQKLSFLTLFR
jgi:hypothetical protein